MFFICLSIKILTSSKMKHIISLPTIQKVVSLIYIPFFFFSDLWYYLSKLITKKSSHLQVMLSMSCFHIFWSLLNLCESCYSYSQACHFATNLKFSISSNQCWPGLSEARYWWIHPTIPYSTCFTSISGAICWLYYGYWNWLVYSSICHFNILLSC